MNFFRKIANRQSKIPSLPVPQHTGVSYAVCESDIVKIFKKSDLILS